MIVSNDFNGDTCDALAEQLVGLTIQDADLTHREILTALIGAIGNTLASISCKDCREVAAQFVRSTLPGAVGGALDFAAKHSGGQPPGSDHVH